ncbi:MAG TPA: lytic transglycosylase domain-containing protein, partial [Acidiphilium sp.]
MRGAVKKLSRLSVAQAVIVSAALLATVAHPGAAQAGQKGATPDRQTGSARPVSVAYAIPRSAPANGAETALAQPLTPSDAAIYARIFADQQDGRTGAAERLIARVQNPLLMGQVLAQLYLGPYHHATSDELSAWLAKYNGQPHTRRIRELLLKRLPRGATPPPPAKISYLPEQAITASGAAPARHGGIALPRYMAERV